MYDPTVGRFITLDPIGFDGRQPNPYQYVGNGPTNATDPSGLQAVPVRLPPVEPYAIHRSGDTITVTGRLFTDSELRARGLESAGILIPRVPISGVSPPLPIGGQRRGVPPKKPAEPKPETPEKSAIDTKLLTGTVELASPQLRQFSEILFKGMTAQDIEKIKNDPNGGKELWRLIEDNARKNALELGKKEWKVLLGTWGEDNKNKIPDNGEVPALVNYGALNITDLQLSVRPQINGSSLYSLTVSWSVGAVIKY